MSSPDGMPALSAQSPDVLSDQNPGRLSRMSSPLKHLSSALDHAIPEEDHEDLASEMSLDFIPPFIDNKSTDKPLSPLRESVSPLSDISIAIEKDTTTPDVTMPDIENSEQYDTDIELNEEDEIEKLEGPDLDKDVGTGEYKRSCSRLNRPAENKVVNHLNSAVLSLKHQGMGEDGAKALAKSLMKNTKVEKLELNDNSITPMGTTFLADMLCDNIYITYLDLSRNDVGTFGSVAIKEMLLWNSSLLHLILQDCKIKDSDCVVLAEGIQQNEGVVYLDMSHNELCEDGAMCLGNAIGINNSLEQLSLAWNHIRLRGAVQICKGLKRNYSLVKVDLSWNGLGYDGALSLGQALKVNKYIRELDVSSNRFTWNCAAVIAAGLKDNYTLEVLKIGLNPLTMTGVLELLNSVSGDQSECEYLSFEGIPINRKIAYIAERLSNTREFSISHGGILDTDDVMGVKPTHEDDPLTRLMAFLDDRNVRPVELFRSLEKTKDNFVSKEQFIIGLKKAQVPLETWEMIQVIEKLDKSAEGRIDYRKLNVGIKSQKASNKKAERKQQAMEKRRRQKEEKLMNPEFTAGARNSVKENKSNTASASQSRRKPALPLSNTDRASRVSLAVSQSFNDERRQSSLSLLSGRSSALRSRPSLTSNSLNPALDRIVSSEKRASRQDEVLRKLGRLSASDSRAATPATAMSRVTPNQNSTTSLVR